MRLGTVSYTRSYVVDLDKPLQIMDARDAIYDDVMESVKHGDQLKCEINVKQKADLVQEAKLKHSDIPDFISKECEDDWGQV